MNCISSPALDDIEITKYVDGEADETVIAHIKECPFCREKASRRTLTQNRLKKQLYRVDCPSPMELGDYHLRLLPASQMLMVAQHVQGCPLCRREVAELEDFLKDSVAKVGLSGRAKMLFAGLTGGPTASGAREQNGLAPAVSGLRGKAEGPLTFGADGIVIVLDIEPSDQGKAKILGQVAAADQDQWTGALAELSQGHQLQFSTTVDDLGAFRFEGVLPGTQTLRIVSRDSSLIVVSNFEVSL
jgi:hypothetical protein